MVFMGAYIRMSVVIEGACFDFSDSFLVTLHEITMADTLTTDKENLFENFGVPKVQKESFEDMGKPLCSDRSESPFKIKSELSCDVKSEVPQLLPCLLYTSRCV